ncbi:MAG: PhoH family protein, partial [Desulfovibrio sp.]|nr:PhoH family protein [Desulfovibrio sp.]
MTEQGVTSRRLEFKDSELANKLFGPQGGNLALLAEKCGVGIETRGATATLSGPADAVDLVAS